MSKQPFDGAYDPHIEDKAQAARRKNAESQKQYRARKKQQEWELNNELLHLRQELQDMRTNLALAQIKLSQYENLQFEPVAAAMARTLPPTHHKYPALQANPTHLQTPEQYVQENRWGQGYKSGISEDSSYLFQGSLPSSFNNM